MMPRQANRELSLRDDVRLPPEPKPLKSDGVVEIGTRNILPLLLRRLDSHSQRKAKLGGEGTVDESSAIGRSTLALHNPDASSSSFQCSQDI